MPALQENPANAASYLQLFAASSLRRRLKPTLRKISDFIFQRSSTNERQQNHIGYIVQLAGIGAFALGAVLSFHHAAIAASFAGGAAAFYVGKKIRALSAAPAPAAAVAKSQ
jgi:hypothetical protein